MKKKILFLDDNHARHHTIRPYLLHDEAFTAGECITLLQQNQYDVVFLDHDLGGKEMISSFAEEETGYTVAKWIAENKPAISLVVVHSLNPGGRENIASLLRSAGYRVEIQPFLTLREAVSDLLESLT